MMGNIQAKILIEEYRINCNLLTERIGVIYNMMKKRMPRDEYDRLSARLKTLREERIDMLNTMRTLQEYCR